MHHNGHMGQRISEIMVEIYPKCLARTQINSIDPNPAIAAVQYFPDSAVDVRKTAVFSPYFSNISN